MVVDDSDSPATIVHEVKRDTSADGNADKKRKSQVSFYEEVTAEVKKDEDEAKPVPQSLEKFASHAVPPKPSIAKMGSVSMRRSGDPPILKNVSVDDVQKNEEIRNDIGGKRKTMGSDLRPVMSCSPSELSEQENQAMDQTEG